MRHKSWLAIFLTAGFLLQAQQDQQSDEQKFLDANCVFFGPNHDKLAKSGLNTRTAPASSDLPLSAVTESVVQQLPALPSRGRSGGYVRLEPAGTIDKYLFSAMAQAGVAPAASTNDFEFIRRATLDLTGRIPTPDRVQSFVADPTPDKRARLVDELLAKPEWTDKWTMYFGDLFKNTIRNTQVDRQDEGRNAFYKWIHDSLAANKPYDQIARDLISTQADNSFTTGSINWLVGGIVTGGPRQDIYDQQAVNVSQTFLGISHMNCLLCHNGRGHLDSLSLWGSKGTRYRAWQFSSFLSHTATFNTPVGDRQNHYYWSVLDDTARARVDYQLNTTTGNRPARQPAGTQATVAPVYWFSGRGPNAGEDYRVALGREVTSDFQFARAAVNYVWNEFFGRGIVDPPDQFDPARLDPDNPPPAPWTLQPSNPYLLNALAKDFIASKYDLKALMREITTSQAYQLSSRYDGTWNAAWEPLFARKLVRRLWGEEIHDSIAQSSSIIPSYSIGSRFVTFGTVSFAMQFPEPMNLPDGPTGPVTTFLDAFLRGNRDDEQRRDDGSISQALDLMNDNFVMTRVRATGSSLLAKNINLTDEQLVSNLFLTVLSRYPTDAEKAAALADLKAGNRTTEAQNLLWELYNKVDFIFNY